MLIQLDMLSSLESALILAWAVGLLMGLLLALCSISVDHDDYHESHDDEESEDESLAAQHIACSLGEKQAQSRRMDTSRMVKRYRR